MAAPKVGEIWWARLVPNLPAVTEVEVREDTNKTVDLRTKGAYVGNSRFEAKKIAFVEKIS